MADIYDLVKQKAQGKSNPFEVDNMDLATNVTEILKNITAQIDHTEQLLLKNPMTLNFGLEY